jgi:hypothetical protein
LFIIFAAADAGPVMSGGLQPTPMGGGPRRDSGSAQGAVSYVDTATRADWARLRRRVLLAVSLVVTALF